MSDRMASRGTASVRMVVAGQADEGRIRVAYSHADGELPGEDQLDRLTEYVRAMVREVIGNPVGAQVEVRPWQARRRLRPLGLAERAPAVGVALRLASVAAGISIRVRRGWAALEHVHQLVHEALSAVDT